MKIALAAGENAGLILNLNQQQMELACVVCQISRQDLVRQQNRTSLHLLSEVMECDGKTALFLAAD